MIIRLKDETHDEIREKYGKVNLWQAAVQTREEDIANTDRFEDLVKPHFVFKSNRQYSYNYPDSLKDDKGEVSWCPELKAFHKEADKVWKDAKKQTKLTYRNNAVAFLTAEETAKLKKAKATKNDMFWAAQKNVVEYKSRPATEEDLVY